MGTDPTVVNAQSSLHKEPGKNLTIEIIEVKDEKLLSKTQPFFFFCSWGSLQFRIKHHSCC